jgi:hypothetical protein
MKYQKIPIWRAFLPETNCFSHLPGVYPPFVPMWGPPRIGKRKGTLRVASGIGRGNVLVRHGQGIYMCAFTGSCTSTSNQRPWHLPSLSGRHVPRRCHVLAQKVHLTPITQQAEQSWLRTRREQMTCQSIFPEN